MASVVFLRGSNVGGHNTFRPAALAKELVALDMVNIGAAGTFVVHRKISDARLRAEILQRLSFQPEIMICPRDAMVALMKENPFRKQALATNDRPFLSIMTKAPAKLPRLPLSVPAGDRWEVKLVRVIGNLALTLWRPAGPNPVYPNEVIEKQFGLSTTTRSWKTIEKICKILSEPEPRG
jgi:uncharacterized protein (DUF1697 family)